MNRLRVAAAALLSVAVLFVAVSGRGPHSLVRAADPERAMFGNTFDRNMVSGETGLPADWDIKTGKNVLWWADVGSQAYAGPVVLGVRQPSSS